MDVFVIFKNIKIVKKLQIFITHAHVHEHAHSDTFIS